MREECDAPWSTRLQLLTAVFVLVLAAAGGSAVAGLLPGSPPEALAAGGVFAAILGACAALLVRGYRVEPGTLRVLRPE